MYSRIFIVTPVGIVAMVYVGAFLHVKISMLQEKFNVYVEVIPVYPLTH